MILVRSYFVKDSMQESGPFIRALREGEKLDGKGSPTKVRDAITNVLTHRIEKLPCIEIREE